MRAPWNTTCDVYRYPVDTLWEAPIAVEVPCRLVPQTKITAFGGYQQYVTHWLTIPGPYGAQLISFDIFRGIITADLSQYVGFAIPTGTVPGWIAYQTERIQNVRGGPYYRFLIGPVPF